EQQQRLVGCFGDLKERRMRQIDNQEGRQLLLLDALDLEQLLRISPEAEAPGDVLHRLARTPLVHAGDVVACSGERASMLAVPGAGRFLRGLEPVLDRAEPGEDLLYLHGGTSV